MFEVGRDIFKHGSNDVRTPRGGKWRTTGVLWLFCLAFVLFITKTIYLGAVGSNENRVFGSGDWNVSRADIVDRNGIDIWQKIWLPVILHWFHQDWQPKTKNALQC